MKYVTYFILSFSFKNDIDSFAIEDDIVEILNKNNYDWDERLFSQIEEFKFSAEWKERDSDLIKISKKFPNITFRLEGFGSTPGDWWIAIYKNGKYAKEFCWKPAEPSENDLIDYGEEE